jgi:hypothetical protein
MNTPYNHDEDSLYLATGISIEEQTKCNDYVHKLFDKLADSNRASSLIESFENFILSNKNSRLKAFILHAIFATMWESMRDLIVDEYVQTLLKDAEKNYSTDKSLN